MNDVKALRRTNAKLLAKLDGGPADFARKIQKSDSYVSQLIGENPIRNIGHATARLIERAHGKPPGWLDRDNTQGYSLAAADIAAAFDKLPLDRKMSLEPIIAAAIGYALPDSDVARYLPAAPESTEPTLGEDDATQNKSRRKDNH